MPLYTKPGDAWQEPEHIRSQQPDGTMQEVEVVRAKVGSEYVDVWPEYEQEVHYLMLYDGSLGQAGANGANACLEVTGGWSRGYSGNTSDYREEFTSSYMRVYTGVLSRGYVQGLFTNQKINFANYDSLIIFHEPYRTLIDSSHGYVALSNTAVVIASNRNQDYMHNTSSAALYGYVGGLTQQKKRILSFNIADVSTSYYIGFMDNYGEGGDKIFEAFVVKSDDWQTWLSKAGISAASLEAVMSDSAALTTLLSNRLATQYMLLQCTGDVMAAAIQSATFKAALETSPYKDKIYANPHWAKFLAMV